MADRVFEPGELPVGSLRYNATGWWGTICLIATEASLFIYLLFSYYFFAVQHGKSWLPDPHPSWALAGPDTLVLILSSVAVWWGEGGIKKGNRVRHLIGTGIAIALGVTFLIVQVFEWKSKTLTPQSGSYGSLFFTITGFHMVHVIVGVLVLCVVFAWSAAGFFNERRYLPVTISSTYWHFVDVVWLAVFFTFYVTPLLW